MPRIEITTDAAWRDITRMTATEKESAKKTGFGLLAQQAINDEMMAEGEAIWAEIGGGR